MKVWIIPMKGKGFEVTARNIASVEPEELARPLTTDEWDNMMLTEDGKDSTDAHGRETKDLLL